MLNDYPNIQKAYRFLCSGDGIPTGSYVSRLVENSNDDNKEKCFVPWSVHDVERCLDYLWERGLSEDDLAEQIEALFTKNEVDWNRARTELLAYCFLEKKDCLAQVGHLGQPGHFRFDGLLFVSQNKKSKIAFDVKPAYGSGLQLLRQLLYDELVEWASANSIIPRPDIEINFQDIITQETVRKASDEGFLADFRSMLDGYSSIPTEPIRLRLSNGHVDIDVCRHTEATVDVGVTGVERKNKKVARTLAKHVETKARNQEPFVIIYINPFGYGGSDVNSESFASLMKHTRGHEIAGVEWWLGSILVTFSANIGTSTFFERINANWPAGSSGRTLASSLQIDKML